MGEDDIIGLVSVLYKHVCYKHFRGKLLLLVSVLFMDYMSG